MVLLIWAAPRLEESIMKVAISAQFGRKDIE